MKTRRQTHEEEGSAIRVEDIDEVGVGLVHPDRRVHQIYIGSRRLQSCMQISVC